MVKRKGGQNNYSALRSAHQKNQPAKKWPAWGKQVRTATRCKEHRTTVKRIQRPRQGEQPLDQKPMPDVWQSLYQRNNPVHDLLHVVPHVVHQAVQGGAEWAGDPSKGGGPGLLGLPLLYEL